jgi:hypothetical protein
MMDVSDIEDALRELSVPHHDPIKTSDQSEHAEDTNESGGSDKAIEALSGGIKLLAKAENREDVKPATTYPKVMTLDVGGRIFKVSRDTLKEFGLFRYQLSDRFTWEPESDGTYFLDADPDLFEHLLSFMRRPEVFPLFYTKDAGFDYNLYNRLEAEANYFQMDALRDWIKAKKYLKAIVTQTYSAEVRRLDMVPPQRRSVNISEDWHVIPRTRKVYICPRGIWGHRDDPNSCGHACRKARGDDEIEYEDETYEEAVILKKEVEFVAEICKLE